MKSRAYLSRTAALLDSTDWSRTPLGERAGWPVSLRSYVSMVMSMPSPAILFWGPSLTQIYNDGYAQVMGPRHPRYFGAPYQDCWPETYPLIYPWMRRVLDHGEVVEVERECIPLTRLGFEEDAYFTFTFTPLRDDDGRIAGILQPVFEVTHSVLAERRAGVLRRLASLPGGQNLWCAAVAVLGEVRDDVPEALIGEIGAGGRFSIVAATPGAAMASLGGDALLRLAVDAGDQGGWAAGADGPRTLALPLSAVEHQTVRRVLLVRTNPRLQVDAPYREFLEMVAAELSAALQRAEVVTAEARQRAYLDRLFLQAPAGIAVLRGPHHVFELVNPMYQALVGHREVRGLPLHEALPEMVGQPFIGHLDAVRRSGRPYVGLAESTLLARKPGGAVEQTYFNFVYQPLQDEGQAPDGILVFCYEVTEQVLARQRSERLAQALREEHQRKDEFLAMLAHELRNPLAPVTSAAEVLLRAPGDARVVETASRIIARQAQHLSGLIDDLLDVSRVTRGLVTLDREPQDLRTVLLDATEQVRPLAEARGHRLLLDLPPQRLRVLGDHKRLVQIFANLLNNAAKYTPDGGQVTLGLQAVDDHAVVSVVDTGIGIDAELLARVFELFVQGERSAARAAGGLGIGLALARSLVEMHGGRIAAHSDGEGRGSRFEVTLPTLAPADDTAADTPAPGRMPSGEGRPVLVVDDNVDAAQMLALQLQLAGYAVDVVHGGRATLDACAQRHYFACLIDMGLPDLHGTEVAARLKAGSAPVPLLVAVSGYGQPADLRTAREAGFDQYFVKPVDIAPLTRLLHERAAVHP